MPDGWIWTTIGEITEPIGKVDPKVEPEKQFTYLDISGIDNTRNVVAEPKVYYGADAPSRARQSVREGDVLFSTVRTYLKNIAQVPEIYDGQVASTGFSILRGRAKVSNKYLFYYSLTDAFLNPLAELQRGTSYPAVRDGNVRGQPIPLAPLSEQERIVAEIEKQFTRLDQAVAGLRRLQNNLARYKASVLKAACEGRLVPQDPGDEPAADLLARILAERRAQWQAANPKKKYQEPVGVGDTAVMPDLPEGWAVATIDQVTYRLTYGITVRPKYVENGVPVISAREIRSGSLDLEIAKQISEDDFTGLREKCKLSIGDVLFSKTGTIGHVAQVKTTRPLCSSQNIAVLSSLIDSSYLELFLRTPFIQKLAQSHVKTTAIPDLQLGLLRQFPIMLPPLAEQKRIVAEVERRLSVVAATEQAIATNLARAERLRQSILHRAFTGRLV